MYAETPGVPFTDVFGCEQFLRVTNEHVHLGTALRADGHEVPNLRRCTHASVRCCLEEEGFSNPYVTRTRSGCCLRKESYPSSCTGRDCGAFQRRTKNTPLRNPSAVPCGVSYAPSQASAANPFLHVTSRHSWIYRSLRSFWLLKGCGRCVR